MEAPLAVWEYVFTVEEALKAAENQMDLLATHSYDHALCHDGWECEPGCVACYFAGKAARYRHALQNVQRLLDKGDAQIWPTIRSLVADALKP